MLLFQPSLPFISSSPSLNLLDWERLNWLRMQYSFTRRRLYFYLTLASKTKYKTSQLSYYETLCIYFILNWIIVIRRNAFPSHSLPLIPFKGRWCLLEETTIILQQFLFSSYNLMLMLLCIHHYYFLWFLAVFHSTLHPVVMTTQGPVGTPQQGVRLIQVS